MDTQTQGEGEEGHWLRLPSWITLTIITTQASLLRTGAQDESGEVQRTDSECSQRKKKIIKFNREKEREYKRGRGRRREEGGRKGRKGERQE